MNIDHLHYGRADSRCRRVDEIGLGSLLSVDACVCMHACIWLSNTSIKIGVRLHVYIFGHFVSLIVSIARPFTLDFSQSRYFACNESRVGLSNVTFH